MNFKTIKNSIASRFVPFLAWIPELKKKGVLRNDIIAGITVAMVLIPQSMAYASLAGLPPYYGLYAAFLPPMVAALFGSSRQLATGPVAVVSLLTASALGPIITQDASSYVYYAILLALLVGLFQISLGLLRLGVVLNFLSHPVIIGFTNAAAIIIATSQLNKIFGVDVDKAPDDFHYVFVWDTLVAATKYIHWPTFCMAVLAVTIMIMTKRKSAKLPYILFAVATTTIISVVFTFHEETKVSIDNIKAPQIVQNIRSFNQNKTQISKLGLELKTSKIKFESMEREFGEFHSVTLNQHTKIVITKSELNKLRTTNQHLLRNLKLVKLVSKTKAGTENQPKINQFYLQSNIEAADTADSIDWHISKIEINDKKLDIVIAKGGKIVHDVPSGLPGIIVPGSKIEGFGWNTILTLFPMAMVIALIGFMEAISIAKAMASRTRQRIDANQELIGQGLSNITGSFFQSYAVSGSFSRSAVNIESGAVTGFSSVVTSIMVAVTLLFFTPLLYHLPQATLAAVIMMAVIGLVNIRAVKHAWEVNKHDGIVAIVTFSLTIIYAPHLEMGIMIGIALSLVLFLWRTMAPRIVFVSKHSDGTLRDAKSYNLDTCEEIAMLRFEGSLYFANTSYLEDKVQKIVSQSPKLKFLIIDGVSINQVDAAGEEMLREICRRMGEIDIEVLLTRFKKPILDMLEKTHFITEHGREHFYRKPDLALEYAWSRLEKDHKKTCPLNIEIKSKTEK